MIIQKNADKQYVLCVVYEPNVRDAHDDWMTAEEIEKSCHEFTRSLQKQVVVGDMALRIIAKLYKTIQTGGDVEVDVTDLLSAVDVSEYKRQLEAGNAIGLGIQHAVWD
ncbi:MAG: XkdF-like putative serine protease domain-containing protein, partial [bacterium]